MQELTENEIEAGWHKTFSTSNPFYALGHPIQIAPSTSSWASINPASTLADRLDQLPEINFSNYDQGDVEALQAWAIEAYTLLAATLVEKKCTRCEYIGHCDCEVTEGK